MSCFFLIGGFGFERDMDGFFDLFAFLFIFA